MPQSGSAAVSLITNGDSILFIRRNERKDDPWSGNIAFPGGFIKGEERPEEAAIRETFEETSLILQESQITGRIVTMHSMRYPSVSVYPFIFSVGSFEGYAPGDEVSDIRVIRVTDLQYSSTLENHGAAYVNNGWVIWGLTYRILRKYFGLD